MNKTIATVAYTIFILLLTSAVAMASPPNVDSSFPTKYTNERALYRGFATPIPPASSSDRSVTSSARLGETFPKTIYTPTFAGRITGHATLDKLTPVTRQVPDYIKRKPSDNVKPKATPRVKSFGASLSTFPQTRFTPVFAQRWEGDSRTAQ